MSKLFIPVLIGTTRGKRKSHYAAKFVQEIGNSFDNVETVLVDPKDFKFEGDGNDPEGKDPNYTKITEKADAFFVIIPEYNHSFPGSLKRMLDSELSNYIHKPLAMAGVSAGGWGGVRAIESMVVPARELGFVLNFADLQFPKVQELFDENGELKDKSYIERAERSWKELIWMAETMKYGRENIPSKYHS